MENKFESPEIVIDEIIVEKVTNSQDKNNNLLIPASIIIAGFFIATGIYFSQRGNAPVTNNNVVKQAEISISPITEKDHILGNPDAPISLVEFSDTECPYCKMFQSTMQTIMSTYGKDGKVAWVYRHFPIHTKSRKEVEATECVNELGGNTAFWKMLDTIYTNTSGNNSLDAAKLPGFAKGAGVDITAFNTCWNSGKYAALAETYYQDAIKSGVQGTPYNVLVLKNKLSKDAEETILNFVASNNLSENISISASKKEVVLNGALPVEMVKTVLDAILK